MSDGWSLSKSFVAEHEATHVVIALVTMGNRPESVTIEPGEGYGGRRVGRESVAGSVAESREKRRIRRAMTLLAPAVLVAPYDLFARSDAEFLEYFFAPGQPHSGDAQEVMTLFLLGWGDTPQALRSIVGRIVSRTKVLLHHELVERSIKEIRDRLLLTPTLYTADLADVTRKLLSERQSIMSWLRAQMRAGSETLLARPSDQSPDGNRRYPARRPARHRNDGPQTGLLPFPAASSGKRTGPPLPPPEPGRCPGSWRPALNRQPGDTVICALCGTRVMVVPPPETNNPSPGSTAARVEPHG